MAWEREEVIWAAGLFEGEGCWTLIPRYNKTRHYAHATLSMTDEDIVREFAAVFGLSVYGPYRNVRKGKPFWQAHAGNWQLVQAMGAAMWPWLGPRRRARWQEVLAAQPKRR